MRIAARSWVLVALLLAGCGDEGGSGGRGSAVKPRGFQGQFTGEGPEGSVTITLVQTGDIVEIISSGNEKIVGRLVAADRVEAETREGNGHARATLTLDGDNLRMHVTATDAEGTTREVPEFLLRRVGVPSPPAGGGAAGGARDVRLVAHWLSTETRSSPQLSYAKDTHFVLNADGTFETWDKTVSSLSGTEESARTRGTWKTEGGQLWIKPDQRPEWFSAGKFGLTDTHLMLTDARGEKTVYERL